ncbi:hypothetical protein BKA70DRAFT_1572973 [Coprinopsis sp. MPI-PUGE-AT-0042]|nr:hypothetical protein BKA70DRAFT_1572973 [Coprinopsis sp. MPI-PUGE-AT-0042]
MASIGADVAEYLRPHGEVASTAIPMVGSLSSMQVVGETVNFVEGDQHQHYHQHIHAPLQPTNHDIPAILEHIPNYRDIHIANLERATEGTGPCFDEWEEFCEWRSVQGALKTMWGSGMPGAGKTIFASIIINEVEARAKASERPICVGYIYFRYSDHTTATVRDFLLVLVKQTIERHADCLPIFNEVFARHIREKTLPSESELVQLLRRFAEVIAEMFYFLDALDEAPPDVQFDLLKKLSTLNVKIFITSRPIANLDSRFPGAHRFSIRAQDRDLELHIAKEIERSPVLQTILDQGGPLLRKKIISTIKEKCGGMFLHASLQLDALRGCASVYAVEKTLEDFPRQIDEVYRQTWERIQHQAPDMFAVAKNALVWVLCATRSLTIEELRHAVATCPDTYKFDRRRLVDDDTLMGLCRGLVDVEEGTNIVRFIPTPNNEDALLTALRDNSLLAYAYDNWSTHARKSLLDISLAGRLSQFIQGCSAFPLGLSRLFLDRDPSIDEILEPLHMAAYFDFPLSVVGSAHLCDPNHPTPHQGQTPLMLATTQESLSAMRELLSLPGILINAVAEDGDPPLVRAALFDLPASLSLLLAHPKINVNAANSNGGTALSIAHSEEIATLLLAHPKIKTNQVDSGGNTALMRASNMGSLGVVKVLLADPRVQVNLKSKDGRTALERVEEEDLRHERPEYGQIIELLRTHSNREDGH